MLFNLLGRTDEPIALMAAWPGARRGKDQLVHMSSVDLRDVRDGARLAAFMARPEVLSMRLTAELPVEHPTQLAELLDDRRLVSAASPQSPVGPAGPRVGRNDQCTCGSGKKFKKCCLGQVSRRRPRRALGNGAWMVVPPRSDQRARRCG